MTADPHNVTVTRDFAAPIELVWRAWTDPAIAGRWMKCEPDVVLTYTGWVPEVGARFSSEMTKPGAWTARVTGEFLIVEPPRLLAYCMDANPGLSVPRTVVRVELARTAAGTRVTVTHSGIPDSGMCGVIEGGWNGSLSLLGRELT